MDTEISVGDIVISLSGHDKNQPFIVASIDKNGYCGIISQYDKMKYNAIFSHLNFVNLQIKRWVN